MWRLVAPDLGVRRLQIKDILGAHFAGSSKVVHFFVEEQTWQGVGSRLVGHTHMCCLRSSAALTKRVLDQQHVDKHDERRRQDATVQDMLKTYVSCG